MSTKVEEMDSRYPTYDELKEHLETDVVGMPDGIVQMPDGTFTVMVARETGVIETPSKRFKGVYRIDPILTGRQIGGIETYDEAVDIYNAIADELDAMISDDDRQILEDMDNEAAGE